MSNIYSDETWNRIQLNERVDDHTPDLSFNNNDTMDNAGNYEHFGATILSDNKEITKGEEIKQKMIASKMVKAEKLGLRGKEFSDFIELNVLPSVEGKKNKAKQNLTTPIESKTIEKPSSPIQGDTLIEVLKNGSNENNEIMSKLVEGLDHLTSLIHNQVEMMNQANQIALEANKINELRLASEDSKNVIMVENTTSQAQSLEYLPSLIETIAVSSDRSVELGNVSNAHALQKNVNDSYAFNYNKDDETGSVKSLGAIANHLAVNAGATVQIQAHQEKQAKHAENKIRDFDDENSSEFQNLFDDISDFFMSASTDILEEFDIFGHILSTRIGLDDVK